jgi:hypothetical protein
VAIEELVYFVRRAKQLERIDFVSSAVARE